MFNPLRVAAITAVLALTGTLALVSGPFAPTGPSAVTDAEAPAGLMEPAHFTGTLAVWRDGVGEIEHLPDRVVDRSRSRWTSEMTDPRVSGTGVAMDYLETIPAADGDAFMTSTSSGRQSNDEGSYVVECHGGGSYGSHGRIFCWYEGEEAYAGLTAFMILSGTGLPSWDVEGWIYPGERPPLPEFEP